MPDDRNAAAAKAPSANANAKDAGKGAPADGAKAAKKKNPKLLVLGGAAAALLLIAGAAGWFLTRPKADDSAAAADAKGGAAKGEKGKKGEDGAKGKDKKAEAKKPVFVDLDMITVNLKDPEKFLQIKLTFQLRNPDAVEPVKELMPMLRNAVIPVLGAQDAAELMTPEGKEKLSTQVVDAANKALVSTEVADAIDAVLITHMIIQ